VVLDVGQELADPIVLAKGGSVGLRRLVLTNAPTAIPCRTHLPMQLLRLIS
jgi:hypothetical protein